VLAELLPRRHWSASGPSGAVVRARSEKELLAWLLDTQRKNARASQSHEKRRRAQHPLGYDP